MAMGLLPLGMTPTWISRTYRMGASAREGEASLYLANVQQANMRRCLQLGQPRSVCEDREITLSTCRKGCNVGIGLSRLKPRSRSFGGEGVGLCAKRNPRKSSQAS